MNLFDAHILAADDAAIVAGSFEFHADPDSVWSYLIPANREISLEVNERVIRIRPVMQSFRRADGFYDAESADFTFSSGQITSSVLSNQSSPGHPTTLEAEWTGHSGLLVGTCGAEGEQSSASVMSSIGRLRLRKSFTSDGLHVSLIGEVKGVIVVGGIVPARIPKGSVRIEFTLPWSWIAIRGWSLIWAMPRAENQEPANERLLLDQDPRHFESLMLRAPAGSPLLVGTMSVDGEDPLRRIKPGSPCTHLGTDIDGARISLCPCSNPLRLDTGLFQSPLCTPVVDVIGLGFIAIQQALSESHQGVIELNGSSIGTITLDSDEEREVTRSIKSISASLGISAEGIKLFVRGKAGLQTIRCFGSKVAVSEDPSVADSPVVTFEISVLFPAAFLMVRNRALYRYLGRKFD